MCGNQEQHQFTNLKFNFLKFIFRSLKIVQVLNTVIATPDIGGWKGSVTIGCFAIHILPSPRWPIECKIQLPIIMIVNSLIEMIPTIFHCYFTFSGLLGFQSSPLQYGESGFSQLPSNHKSSITESTFLFLSTDMELRYSVLSIISQLIMSSVI